MAKAKKIKTLGYSDFHRIEDELFQVAIRTYCCTNPKNFDGLVSPSGVKGKVYDLLEKMDDFIIEDKKNGVKVKAYLERFSYNSRTGQGIGKVTIETLDISTKDAQPQYHSEYRKLYIDSDEKAPCASSLLEDIISLIANSAIQEYGRALKHKYGDNVEFSYFDA